MSTRDIAHTLRVSRKVATHHGKQRRRSKDVAKHETVKQLDKEMMTIDRKAPEVSPVLEKALQMRNDPRYKDMQRFQERGNDKDGHFARLVCRRTVKPRKDADSTSSPTSPRKSESAVSNESGDVFDDIARKEAEIDDHMADNSGLALKPKSRPDVAGVAGRLDWQRAFAKSLGRLMIDFDLATAPAQKVGHLDRMHDWFTKQGQKQGRKTKEGPSYVVGSERRPGCTTNGWMISSPASRVSDRPSAAFDGVFSTNKSRRRGVIPAPAGLSSSS
eukprot:TRINITY_DN27621_c0_g2_i1.p1 TRINITY_DN27621_c0_g2~~TRINITY_DN27621_c0_g2_i1.p1  ORF type:complete len:274 (+),score=47.20 TRINITY_DN27621_c0_g2_i1:124-945(+)